MIILNRQKSFLCLVNFFIVTRGLRDLLFVDFFWLRMTVLVYWESKFFFEDLNILRIFWGWRRITYFKLFFLERIWRTLFSFLIGSIFWEGRFFIKPFFLIRSIFLENLFLLFLGIGGISFLICEAFNSYWEVGKKNLNQFFF